MNRPYNIDLTLSGLSGEDSSDIEEYINKLENRVENLAEALEDLILATTSVRGIDSDMEEWYCPREFEKARSVLKDLEGV